MPDTSLKPQAEARGIVLDAALTSQPTPISGDEDKLHQVLANLVSNSLRFTPPVQLAIMGEIVQFKEVLVC